MKANIKKVNLVKQSGGGYADTSLMEITTKVGCSVNCKYCPQDVFVSNYKGDCELSYRNFVECIDKVPEKCSIVFGGFAEAFLNEKCVDLMLYAAKNHCIYLYKTLVGKGIDLESFETIKKIPIEKCVIHIPDEEGFAHIPITEEYVKLLNRIVKSKKKNRQGEVSSFIDHFSCQGHPHHIVVPIIKDYFVLSYLEDRAGNLENEGCTATEYLTGSLMCRKCGTLLNKNMLLPNGDVVLCCNDWGMQHILGNLLYQTYGEIRAGQALKDVKYKMLMEDDGEVICRKCINAFPLDYIELPSWQSDMKKMNL